jgi:hypothetical protein
MLTTGNKADSRSYESFLSPEQTTHLTGTTELSGTDSSARPEARNLTLRLRLRVAGFWRIYGGTTSCKDISDIALSTNPKPIGHMHLSMSSAYEASSLRPWEYPQASLVNHPVIRRRRELPTTRARPVSFLTRKLGQSSHIS